MSAYAIVLHGEGVKALVVGGGAVAARKTAALMDAGAAVRVLSPELSPEMSSMVKAGPLQWIDREYTESLIGDANLIFAATDSASVNATIARDARGAGIMVNVANDSRDGDFHTPAVHRDGSILVAVHAGGVPAAAMRIRDSVAQSLDHGVAAAVSKLLVLRERKLSGGDASGWNTASRELIGNDFIESVASGEFDRRYARWG